MHTHSHTHTQGRGCRRANVTAPARHPTFPVAPVGSQSVWYKALEGGIGKTSPFPLLFLSLSLLIWQSLLKVGHLVLATQSCPALPPVDCSPPGPSVHGILQTRILEWVALSSSRGLSGPRDRTWITRMQADSALSEPPLGECSSCHKD